MSPTWGSFNFGMVRSLHGVSVGDLAAQRQQWEKWSSEQSRESGDTRKIPQSLGSYILG